MTDRDHAMRELRPETLTRISGCNVEVLDAINFSGGRVHSADIRECGLLAIGEITEVSLDGTRKIVRYCTGHREEVLEEVDYS